MPTVTTPTAAVPDTMMPFGQMPFGQMPFGQMPFGQMMDPLAMSRLAFDWWRLCMESSQVIALRSMRMMQGGAVAQREAVRMVSEKWETAALLGMSAATGQAGNTPETAMRGAMQRYQTKVSANRRRLSR
ncbi:hypothetical protein [Croceicoccus marinus]|nr:hypothetical protein [Croceicoccus marinus]